ncbi:MAG: hypothetical protein U1D00_27240 [Mycobacterium sp.]|nr:hypothetical protein [Mycobacterium sp.]
MGARKTPRAKSSRNTRKAVTRARSDSGRGTLLWIGATVVVSAALLGAVIVSLDKTGGDRESEAGAVTLNSTPATVAVGADSLPPWSAPSDAAAAMRAAGLPMMSAEGSVEHIHAHLDVLVDGQAVPVPADIGVDRSRGGMSALHTHDGNGVIHVESPARRQFSLGEFFSEWGVSLSADNIGGLRAADGKTVRVFVNGTLRSGSPAAITFGPRDEIAVVYGIPRPGESIPAKYDFPAGD